MLHMHMHIYMYCTCISKTNESTNLNHIRTRTTKAIPCTTCIRLSIVYDYDETILAISRLHRFLRCANIQAHAPSSQIHPVTKSYAHERSSGSTSQSRQIMEIPALQLRLRCRASLNLGVHLVDNIPVHLCRLRTLEFKPARSC
jgi:hypothetical protein